METAILKITLLFTVVLALTLVVERVVELLKAAYDLADSRHDLHRHWTRRAERLATALERRVRIFEHLGPEAVAGALRRFDEMLLGEKDGYRGTVPVLAGDLVRLVWIRAAAKLLGMLFGVGLAVGMELDLLAAARNSAEPTFWGSLLTGIAIGLGSGPVHKIIVAIEKHRARRERKERLHA